MFGFKMKMFEKLGIGNSSKFDPAQNLIQHLLDFEEIFFNLNPPLP